MLTTAQRVLQELESAREKFKDFSCAHEGYAVILEELDEMWDAIKENRFADARNEAVQVAAMAFRYIEDSCIW